MVGGLSRRLCPRKHFINRTVAPTVLYHRIQLATKCATAFRDKFNDDPHTLNKAMGLRSKLIAGENNDLLMILWDCFGLQGLHAVTALQTLKASLVAA